MDISPEDITWRCDNIKMIAPKTCIVDKIVYFPLPREFDIIFSINSFTNIEHIIKQELCFNGGDLDRGKILDIVLNNEIVCSMYIFRYFPLCVKIEYDDYIHIPDEIEMVYSAGKLTKYRKDRIK